jgi:hypothetical protein
MVYAGKCQPMVGWQKGAGSMTKPASDKQVSFITTLIAERVFEGAVSFATLTSVEASSLITLLMASPRKSGAVAVERVSEVGMYRNAEGDIFKVQRSKESGNLYAKRLNIVEGGFEYVQGAIRLITPSDRMSLEDAKAFGVAYGICCVCGAFLTNEVSVAEGIGPVCGGRV